MRTNTPGFLPMSRQQGLTLVELMVALVLSLLLLLGASRLFIGSKQTFQTSDALARVQENGRFALELIARDLRQAGYSGCVDDAPVANVITNGGTNWLYDFSQPVFGFTGGSSTNPMPSDFDGSSTAATGTLQDSDAVVVLYGDADDGYTVASHNLGSNQITLDQTHGIQANEVLLVTDCARAALFQATSADGSARTLAHAAGGTPGNCTSNLGQSANTGCPATGESYSFANGGMVMPLRSHAYFVAETSRTDSSGTPISALYRIGINRNGVLGTAEELIDGVEDMQVLYGVDNQSVSGTTGFGSANKFLTADQVEAANEWDRVVAIRVTLALRSISPNVTPTNTSYSYGNGTTNTDARIRHRYAMTVAVRNRVP